MDSPSLQTFRTAIDAARVQLAEESARIRDARGLDDLRNRFLSRKRGTVTVLF